MVKTSEGKIYDMASINARNTPQKESVPLITLDDVKLDLESGAGKVNILKGINLKICAGDSVSIVGPSGAGKTSLLMVIAGIEAISSGKILVSNNDLTNLSDDQLAIKYVEGLKKQNGEYLYSKKKKKIYLQEHA